MLRKFRPLIIPLLVGFGLLAGFFREVLLAYIFGASRDIEIFRMAFGLPSIFSDSLAVSFVSVLIPLLIAGTKDTDLLTKQSTFWAACLVAFGGAVLGIVTMPLQARFLAPGFDPQEQEAMISIGRWCWGMYALVIISLPLRAWMSVEGRIWPGAAAQLQRSGGFVCAFLVLIWVTGRVDTSLAGYAAVLAGLVVLVVHVLALSKPERATLWTGRSTRPDWGIMRIVLIGAAVVFCTQIILSGGRILDRLVASEMQVGVLAGLEYSYALLMALGAVIGTSTNLVLSPLLGRMIRDEGGPTRRYWRAISLVTALATVVGIVVSLLAYPIVSLVFENGAFGPEDTARTAAIFRWHALALGPLVLALILIQYLILTGHKGLIIPVACVKLAVKAGALYGLLAAGFGVFGIAISLGVAELAAVGMSVLLATRART